MLSDATVNVLMPGEPFQELYPLCTTQNGQTTCIPCPPGKNCAIGAQVSGQVLIGLGCWCGDPFVDANNNGIPSACGDSRRLQESNLYVVRITDSPFSMAAGEEIIEPASTCTGFLVFCWIQAIVSFLISLLTFGLL